MLMTLVFFFSFFKKSSMAVILDSGQAASSKAFQSENKRIKLPNLISLWWTQRRCAEWQRSKL